MLIIWLYESLTGKTVKQIEGEFSESFSDQRYQIQLPLYARNTASYALKVNTLNVKCSVDRSVHMGRSKSFKSQLVAEIDDLDPLYS